MIMYVRPCKVIARARARVHHPTKTLNNAPWRNPTSARTSDNCNLIVYSYNIIIIIIIDLHFISFYLFFCSIYYLLTTLLMRYKIIIRYKYSLGYIYGPQKMIKITNSALRKILIGNPWYMYDSKMHKSVAFCSGPSPDGASRTECCYYIMM